MAVPSLPESGPQQLLIHKDFSVLKLQKFLKLGNFGRIYLAQYSVSDYCDLAVKIFKGPDSEAKVKAFRKELAFLYYNFPTHKNIIRIIGFCLPNQPLCLITEYVSFELGNNLNCVTNLHEYLLLLREAFKVKLSNGDLSNYPELNHRHLHQFASEIASGMKYLHEKQIVHGDLSSQNILLDSTRSIKISDFGFLELKAHLRHIGQSETGSHRWLAPEVILGNEVFFESDVFSFGILLWHIGTLGGLPFSNFSYDEIFEKVYKNDPNFVLKMPRYFASDFKRFLEICLIKDIRLRPAFANISNWLDKNFRNGCYIDFNDLRSSTEFPPAEKFTFIGSAASEKSLPINPEEFILIKELGRGNFGTARLMKQQNRSLLGHDNFVVKELMCMPGQEKIVFFEQEKEMLKRAGRHVNVTQMLGCYQTDFETCIIMEYVAFKVTANEEQSGLYHYLLFIRNKLFNKENKLVKRSGPIHKELESFALQIASGMAHLEEKGIVHNYGLHGRGIYISKNKNVYSPRWASPELIKHGTDYYTHKSDIWAFAVVLWEIATLGGHPYFELLDDEVRRKITNGVCLAKRPNMTNELWKVMGPCWYYDPSYRPSFKELLEKLRELLQKNEAFVDFEDLTYTFKLPPTEGDIRQHEVDTLRRWFENVSFKLNPYEGSSGTELWYRPGSLSSVEEERNQDPCFSPVSTQYQKSQSPNFGKAFSHTIKKNQSRGVIPKNHVFKSSRIRRVLNVDFEDF